MRTNAEQEVIHLSKEKWRWMSERKVDSLATLFHEKAVFVHMGATMSKDQELDVILSGCPMADVRIVGGDPPVYPDRRLLSEPALILTHKTVTPRPGRSQPQSCWRGFKDPAGHSRIFQKESLRVIFPSANSSRSTPRTSIFCPDADVPVSVHSETPKSSPTQC